MAFDGLRMTPIGGNSRAAVAPMGWGYESSVDDFDAILGTGYFDTFNLQLLPGQFIYVSLTDGKGFVTVDTVDRLLKQVTVDSETLRPFVDIQPENVVPVRVRDDFPAPVSDVITLDPNVNYSLFDTVNLDTCRIVLPFVSTNRIITTFPAVNNLLYAGNDPMISATDFLTFTVEQGVYIYTGAGTAPVFDVDAGAAIGAARFFAFRQVLFGFNSIGTIKNCRLVNLNTLQITDGKDFILENNTQVLIEAMVIEDLSPGPLTTMQILGEIDVSARITNAIWEVGVDQSALYIDPTIGANSRISLLQIDVATTGNGEFFRSGLNGLITQINDNTSNGTVTSITDNSPNGIVVNVSLAHNLELTQEITLSTSTPNYNVSKTVISRPNANAFTLDIPFEGDDTGTYIANSVIVITNQAQFLNDGDTILITGTINYNGGAKIYNSTPPLTFYMNRTFLGIESANPAGFYDAGSLTGADPRVRVFQVEGEKDSKTIFNYGTSGNADPTTIAAEDTFGDLVLEVNPLSPIFALDTERFTLINRATGEFRYDGMEEVTLMLSGFATAFKAGSTERYTFIPTINGVSQEASIVPSAFDIKTEIDTVVFSGVTLLFPGDTIKMQVKTELGNTDSLTIENFSFIGE
ncbi:MAG: hypothetical protein KAV87_12985 [Desulfobacteraceae bacterium]|nr:hypothetical protein [Desulfobacteraceae bacterium]